MRNIFALLFAYCQFQIPLAPFGLVLGAQHLTVQSLML